MKIIALEAENFKRLKAVEINPDGTLQVVGGRNAQGKSSVLDAIWAALGGGKANPEKPIRDGEDRASVKLTLGDITITRTWNAKGTALKVENRDGAVHRSPQGMLDALIGQLSFDPLAFTRLRPREQRDELIRLADLPVDVDALDRERAAVYDARTDVGRQEKQCGDPHVEALLPVEEVGAADLIARIGAAHKAGRLKADAAERLRLARTGRDAALAALKRAEVELAEALAYHNSLPVAPDPGKMERELSGIEDRNAAVRANNAARAQVARRNALRGEYAELSKRIAEIDDLKAQALRSARLPVDGLGFDESGVTYNGIPLGQASSAEQIRVSVAMGMALNPTLRVLIVKDGSLLDGDAMAAIREQVAERDFQIWIERVGDSDDGAVVIEDGMVRNA